MTPEAETEIEKLFHDYQKLIESGSETDALQARKKIQQARGRLDKKQKCLFTLVDTQGRESPQKPSQSDQRRGYGRYSQTKSMDGNQEGADSPEECSGSRTIYRTGQSSPGCLGGE